MANFTVYDQAILYPQPVFVATWLKNVTAYPETNGNMYADVRIMCIPANNTTPGSRNLTQAEASGAARAGGLGMGSLAIVGMSMVFGFLL